MSFSINSIAPCIHIYENIIDFSEKIIDIACSDIKRWSIKNEKATDWQLGENFLGYDEYPVSFHFAADKYFLLLAKNTFDCVSNYSVKNLTTINSYDSCVIRRYSSDPAFLQLESFDIDNPLRKICAILFLNDIEEGGKVNFKNFNISVSPSAGSMLVFPASFAYSFKIDKPSSQQSFIVVSSFT